MKILLINPPYERIPKEIPLGLAYITSYLEKNGHKVDVLDIDGCGYGKKEVEAIVSRSDSDCFGIGGLSSTYRYIKWLTSIIKSHHRGKVVIAGNMAATAHPETLLNNSDVDIAVVGEGEVTCKELLDVLNASGNLDAVKGIGYKKDGKVIFTPPRERIRNPDELPFPAWEHFPVETYLKNPIYREHGLRSLNISTIRGCPFDCVFCSRAFGRTVTKRSIDNIISEIKELIRRYRVQYVAIIDDLFISDQKHVYEFCDKLAAERLKIRWGAAGRVNLINEPLLKKMKAAGCDLLSFGFESGSQKILDIMKKRVKVEEAENAIKLTRKAGIRVIGSFMIGMVGETRQTLEETVNFIKRTDLPNCRFFFATPYPGTALYDMARDMGRLKQSEDAFLEGLGEMANTLAVNLTDFSDQDLIGIKKSAEERLKNEVKPAVKWRRLLDIWQSRLGKLKMELYYKGDALRARIQRGIK